jgi:hypothetical protein
MKVFMLFATCTLSFSLCLSGFSYPDSYYPADSYSLSSKRPEININDKFIDNEVIVITDVSADENSLIIEGISNEITLLMSDSKTETYRISLYKSVDVESALNAYTEIPAVLYAQPNYQIEKDGMLLGDEQSGGVRQWHHEIIHTKEAWELMDRLPGRDCIKVAVIEGAVDINHQDLRENIDLENSCSLANGFKESITSVAPNDHSTHVAGIIAAVSDNNIGSEGVACGSKNDCVKIVSINIYKDENNLTSTDVFISSLQYAVKCGCRVINMSFGVGYGKSQALENAVNSAFNSGAVVVCAAPNNNSTRYALPSDAEQAISVINLSYYGNRLNKHSNSDYGEYKDISAPGTEIYSTKNGNKYGVFTGTSMAAPMVSGVASLVLSTNPGLSSAQVRRMLIWTARDLFSPGWDSDTADGCVDAYQAVYIALWMRDYRLLPDEKLTFSEEIDPLEITTEYLFESGMHKPLIDFFYFPNFYCGSPIEMTTENLEKYIIAFASGKVTACEYLNELLSKSTQSINSDQDYVVFMYNFFLHREPTSEEKQSGCDVLLAANGRSALANQLFQSDEFIQLCKNSYVTVGEGLIELK